VEICSLFFPCLLGSVSFVSVKKKIFCFFRLIEKLHVWDIWKICCDWAWLGLGGLCVTFWLLNWGGIKKIYKKN
jgi:hypothetical protein